MGNVSYSAHISNGKSAITDDVRDKLIDVMYENQKLREENTTLKELLEKVYEFMKQFVIEGVNLLERFLESVGKVVGKVPKRAKQKHLFVQQSIDIDIRRKYHKFMKQEEQMR